MEVKLYSADKCAQMRATEKKYVALCAIILSVASGICVGLCLLARKYPGGGLQWMATAITTIAGWGTLYCFCNEIMPCANRRKFEQKLLHTESVSVRGTVMSIEKPVTVKKGVRCVPVELQQSEKITHFYWDVQIPMPQLVGRQVVLTVAERYITAYEVVQ